MMSYIYYLLLLSWLYTTELYSRSKTPAYILHLTLVVGYLILYFVAVASTSAPQQLQFLVTGSYEQQFLILSSSTVSYFPSQILFM